MNYRLLANEAAIYVLVDPVTNEIRYVGKSYRSLASRRARHIYEARSGKGHRCDWIRMLLRRGYTPRIEAVQVIPKGNASEAERYWIAFYRNLGCELTNGTSGGDGLVDPTPEVRRRMSQARRNWPAESTARMAAALRGRKQPADVVAKRAAANRGQKRTPEACARIGASIPFDIRSVASKKAWETKRARGFAWSPEARAKASEMKVRQKLVSWDWVMEGRTGLVEYAI
jgi:hypothetical protein